VTVSKELLAEIGITQAQAEECIALASLPESEYEALLQRAIKKGCSITDLLKRKRGRGKSAKTLRLVEVATAILEEIQPATVRAVCYRLFVAGLIPNMSKASTDAVSRHLVWARESGLIPWDYIVDETREAERVSTWDNPDSIIRAAVNGYRKDYWAAQPLRVEVWSEKGTLRGTLAPVLQEFGVTFRVMHGYGSATSIYAAAQETADDTKPLTVLYAGDWDPSGLHISEVDLPERFARYGGTFDIQRIALNSRDTATGTSLPHFQADTKCKDPRYRWFRNRYGERCWEVDALSPVVLRERVQHSIIGLLDLSRWNRAVEVEQAERHSMQSFLADWNSNLRLTRKYSEGAAP